MATPVSVTAPVHKPLLDLAKKMPYKKKSEPKWEELAGPLEEKDQILRRDWAQKTLYSSIPVGCLTIASTFLLRNRTIRILSSGVLGLATTALFISGVVYWYLNVSPDKQQLLKLRDEVKEKIRSNNSLKEIREKYPDPRVFSDEELNEWVEYFLETKSFDKLMESQKDAVLDSKIKLKETTRELIKEKFLYHVKYPGNPANIDHFQEIFDSPLYSNFFTSEERDNLNKIRTMKKKVLEERIALESYPDVYNSEQFKNYDLALQVWLFTLHVWKEAVTKGLGITSLKERFKIEISSFTSFKADIERLYCYIAEKEAATLPYNDFVVRNGVEAIRYIKNRKVKVDLYQGFLKHVLDRDLGVLKTRESFKTAIKEFDVPVEDIDSAVRKQECERFQGIKTYKEFRARNGIEQIKEIKEPEILKQLKAEFLKLTPADLKNPIFDEDKKHIGVSDEDIKRALKYFWDGIALHAILSSPADKDIFLDSMKDPPLFPPSRWRTAETIKEIQSYSITDVFEKYWGLFKIGIFSTSDYDFFNKLCGLTIKELEELINKHGSVILETKLIAPYHPKVISLVGGFVSRNAEHYLNEPSTTLPGIGEVIRKYHLIPSNINDVFSGKRERKKEVQEDHKHRLKEIDQWHSDTYREIDQKAEQAIKRAEADIEAKKNSHDKSTQDLASLKERITPLESEVKDLEAKVNRARKTVEEKRGLLQENKKKKEELDKIPKKLKKVKDQHEEAMRKCRDHEESLQQKARESDSFRKLQRDIESSKIELRSLNSQLEDMQRQQDQILAILSAVSDPANSEVGEQKTESRAKESEASAEKPSTPPATPNSGIGEQKTETGAKESEASADKSSTPPTTPNSGIGEQKTETGAKESEASADKSSTSPTTPNSGIGEQKTETGAKESEASAEKPSTPPATPSSGVGEQKIEAGTSAGNPSASPKTPAPDESHREKASKLAKVGGKVAGMIRSIVSSNPANKEVNEQKTESRAKESEASADNPSTPPATPNSVVGEQKTEAGAKESGASADNPSTPAPTSSELKEEGKTPQEKLREKLESLKGDIEQVKGGDSALKSEIKKKEEAQTALIERTKNDQTLLFLNQNIEILVSKYKTLQKRQQELQESGRDLGTFETEYQQLQAEAERIERLQKPKSELLSSNKKEIAAASKKKDADFSALDVAEKALAEKTRNIRAGQIEAKEKCDKEMQDKIIDENKRYESELNGIINLIKREIAKIVSSAGQKEHS